MPILLVFALVGACLPVEWPAPLLGHSQEQETAVRLTVIAVGLALVAALLLRTWVIHTLRRDPGRKAEVAQTYSRLRRLMFFVNVALAALCVVVFGWGWLTQKVLVVEWKGEELLAPFAELMVPLPYFVLLAGTWTIYFDAERTLHQTTVLGPINRPFWSRAGYFFNHLRQFTLILMLPVLLYVTYLTAERFLPPENWFWCRLAMMIAVPLLIPFMPLLFKPILGLKSMPVGPTRDRLTLLAKRLHFRCTDFLLWPTHGAVTNAMIVGLLPRARYVVFTDRILEDLPPDEIDGVFGHEVGHAKHGHVWLYAIFFTLSMTVISGLLLLIIQQFDPTGELFLEQNKGWIALPPLGMAAVYIFLVFGFLSRRCERQADIYGCRAVSCGDPKCLGHDNTTIYPERARGLCPTGIRAFVRALERVDFLNGGPELGTNHHQLTLGDRVRGVFRWLRAWQHSTIPRRVEFLLGLIEHPEREWQFQRRVLLLRWGLLIGLVVALVCMGELIGWQTLLYRM